MAQEPEKVEEQEKEESEGEETPSEKLSVLDQAKKLHEDIKKENDRRENILKEEQKLHAERMLAGTGGGGIPHKEAAKPTDKEYAEAALRGEVLNE